MSKQPVDFNNPHKKAKNLKVPNFEFILKRKTSIPNTLLVGKLSSLALRVVGILHVSQKHGLFLTPFGVANLLQLNKVSNSLRHAYHTLFNCGLLIQVKVKDRTEHSTITFDIVSSTWSIKKFDITHLINHLKFESKDDFKIKMYDYKKEKWTKYKHLNEFADVSNAGRNYSIKPEIL